MKGKRKENKLVIATIAIIATIVVGIGALHLYLYYTDEARTFYILSKPVLKLGWANENVFPKDKEKGYDIKKEREFILSVSQPIEGKVLEVGTGKGHFTCALAQEGYSFTSVDICDEEQKIARDNIQRLGLQDKVNFMIADAQELNFPDACFDHCFSVNMMHHLKEPLKIIDELFRVTKPGGKIIISDFNKKGFFQPYGREHLRDFQPMKPLYCIFDQNGRRGLFVSYKNIAFFSVFEDEIEPFISATN